MHYRKQFFMPTQEIETFFLVKLRHVTGKCFFIQNRMLCSILFSIVNKEIGKKVHFCHNKDHFCNSFFILTTNLAKNWYFSENKKPLYSHFSGKTKSFTQKIQQKKVLQENIPDTPGKWQQKTFFYSLFYVIALFGVEDRME